MSFYPPTEIPQKFLTTTSSVTGTTAKTALSTITVKAGNMGPNDALMIYGLITPTNSANNKTFDIDIGGTNIMSLTGAGQPGYAFLRWWQNRNSLTSQVSQRLADFLPYQTSANALVTSAIDTGQDFNVVFSGTLTNSGETITLEAFTVIVLKAGGGTQPIALLFDGSATSVTGTTAETTLKSATIKAGMVGPNDFIEVFVNWSYTNVARNKTLMVKIGASAFSAQVPTTTATACRRTTIHNRNSVNSQVTWPASVATDNGTTASVVVYTFTENFDTDLTFAITGQPSNAADTITLESVFAILWKAQVGL